MADVPHLVSPTFDRRWFVYPGVIAAAWALVEGLRPRPEANDDVALWVVGVLLIDVAHVWSSLYRTYLDPDARLRHAARLRWTPLLCAWFGFLVHLESPALFWTGLAYLAIFHFIKQHVGFVRLLSRAGREHARDLRLAEACVWASTLGPVLWWHAHLPTQFAWFRAGDLIEGLPSPLGTPAVLVQIPLLVAFVVRRTHLRRLGHRNPTLVGHVLVAALNWNLGIVWFDDDRVFTISNIFLHGVPYLALVWVTGGRTMVERRLGARPRRWPTLLAIYYGAIVLLAYGEEWLWDRLVWHDHPGLFGASDFAVAEHSFVGAIVVAILATPQTTHYVLDRWIWRIGPANPELTRQLGFARRHG